jgi:hypothetical protein
MADIAQEDIVTQEAISQEIQNISPIKMGA